MNWVNSRNGSDAHDDSSINTVLELLLLLLLLINLHSSVACSHRCYASGSDKEMRTTTMICSYFCQEKLSCVECRSL